MDTNDWCIIYMRATKFSEKLPICAVSNLDLTCAGSFIVSHWMGDPSRQEGITQSLKICDVKF